VGAIPPSFFSQKTIGTIGANEQIGCKNHSSLRYFKRRTDGCGKSRLPFGWVSGNILPYKLPQGVNHEEDSCRSNERPVGGGS
jgi:hypothetical protein